LQASGDAKALELPSMGERGREFFVRTTAKLMDETGLTRANIAALLAAEAERFQDPELLGATMPACLLMMSAAGI
jgi:hypothetical protein